LKRRIGTQVLYFRIWRALMQKGLVGEDAIKLVVEECSSVNKGDVVRVLDRLAVFEGFGDIDVKLLEKKHLKCHCGTCTARERVQERGDTFVQPGYWFAALLLRSGRMLMRLWKN
jgi:hypothetical protein